MQKSRTKSKPHVYYFMMRLDGQMGIDFDAVIE